MTRLVALLLVAVLGLGACTRSDPEPTTAELLAEIEGRELTEAEVAQRQEVADLLCGLDDEVLRRIWDQLEPSQLEFQDFVFGRHCQTRNRLYAEETGRFRFEDSTTTTTRG